MTDFEKMVVRLRDTNNCAYVEGRHFEIYDWGIKTIDMRPSTLSEEWISFHFDENGNLIRIS